MSTVDKLDNTSSSQLHDKIRCLTLKFYSYQVLVPNAAIAEVTDFTKVEPKEGAPDWFAGMMRWRDLFIPILVLEKLMNPNASIPSAYKRLLVFNAPGSIRGVPFIGVGCQSIPGMSMVDITRVTPSNRDYAHATPIKLDGQEYIIPDLRYFEEKAKEAFTV